jgi:hypothetical protein
MRIPHSLAALALIPLMAFGAVEKGSWTVGPADQPGKVQFSLQSSSGDHHFDHSSPWQLADLPGLDFATAAKHDVHFSITRDAGTIDCQGFVQEQHGSGLFSFQPNPQYRPEMAKLGFAFEDNKQFSAALFDVSFEFARAMKSTGVRSLDADKLLAFRIHGVSPEFIHGLRSAGIDTTDPDRLIAFRIHGVSPEFVGEIGHMGYPHAPPEQLIALRIHGVTPDYIEGLRSKGLQNLTLDQVITLRIHGVD